jgi:hypothetical protein
LVAVISDLAVGIPAASDHDCALAGEVISGISKMIRIVETGIATSNSLTN